jgi:hypothetical protein
MRKFVLSFIGLLAIGSAAYAQDNSGALRGVYGPGQSGIQATGVGGLGRPAASRPLSGVFGPGQSAAAPPPISSTPTPDRGTSAAAQNVLVSGSVSLGQALPYSIRATPIPDRPGYGLAVINGQRAIIEQMTNRVSQFLD